MGAAVEGQPGDVLVVPPDLAGEGLEDCISRLSEAVPSEREQSNTSLHVQDIAFVTVPSEAQRCVLQLQVGSPAGEVLAVLDGARTTWKYRDIVGRLTEMKPLPPASVYRLVYGEVPLAGDRTLGECGLVLADGGAIPLVVAVVIENPELPKLQDAFEAIVSTNPQDIEDVISMPRVPYSFRQTVDALNILLTGTVPSDPPETWTSSKESFFRNHASLIASFKQFDVDNNPSETISRLAPFIEDDRPLGANTAIDRVRKVIIEWCQVLHRYCANIHLGDAGTVSKKANLSDFFQELLKRTSSTGIPPMSC